MKITITENEMIGVGLYTVGGFVYGSFAGLQRSPKHIAMAFAICSIVEQAMWSLASIASRYYLETSSWDNQNDATKERVGGIAPLITCCIAFSVLQNKGFLGQKGMMALLAMRLCLAALSWFKADVIATGLYSGPLKV